MPALLERWRPMAVCHVLLGFLAVGPGTVASTAQGGIPGNSLREDYLLQYQALVNDGVSRTVAQWEDAWKSGKAAAVAALYLRNAMIVTGTGAVISGPAAIQEFFARNLLRLSDVRLRVYEVVGSGDLASVTGYFTYDVKFGSGGSYPSSVPFSMALLQQRDGSWKIRDQTGGDLPAWFTALDSLEPGMAAGETDTVRVRLAEAGGRPLRHVPVTFQVTHGGGTALPTVVFTDSAGVAAALVTTGGEPGINALLARAAVLPEEPLAFHVLTVKRIGDGDVRGGPWERSADSASGNRRPPPRRP
jgi:uncharacterized protein (TIGR02246 family)